MNHVTAQLQAYFDGELNARTAAMVDAHLVECGACRAELETLGVLSNLLQEVPPARASMPDERFVAQVALQLSRERPASLSERTLKWSWKLAPVMLVATWAIVQTAAILTAGIETLMQFGVGSETLGSLIPEQAARGALEMGLTNSLLDVLGLDGAIEILGQLSAIGWVTVVPVLFTGLTALAICSWIATWWATQNQ